MIEQLNLFANEMNIKEVENFVHNQGLWQTENCFKTEKVKDKNMIIIYNHNTYGTKEEQECCQDTVILEISKDETKAKILSVQFYEITKQKLQKNEFILNPEYYNDYLIVLNKEKL